MKKRVLITGGSGTIGRAFIRNYYNDFISFYNLSRNENSQMKLSRDYPKIPCQFLGNIEDKLTVYRAFEEIKPDIVIHAAAVKHINLAEEQPIHTCNVNVIGSMNVIEAAIRTDVPTVEL